MDVKDIGIKNNFHIYQILVNAAFVIFIILSVVFWVFCYSDYNDNQLLKNGIEVQAEIVDVREIDVSPDDSHSTIRAWECIYLYTAPDGKEYSGWAGQFTQKQYAVEHIGETVTIIIDPTNGYSTRGTLKSIAFYQKNNFKLYSLRIIIYFVLIYFIQYSVSSQKNNLYVSFSLCDKLGKLYDIVIK